MRHEMDVGELSRIPIEISWGRRLLACQHDSTRCWKMGRDIFHLHCSLGQFRIFRIRSYTVPEKKQVWLGIACPLIRAVQHTQGTGIDDRNVLNPVVWLWRGGD